MYRAWGKHVDFGPSPMATRPAGMVDGFGPNEVAEGLIAGNPMLIACTHAVIGNQATAANLFLAPFIPAMRMRDEIPHPVALAGCMPHETTTWINQRLFPIEDERVLMQVAQNGDEAAFTCLVERLAPRLCRYLVAKGMNKADADDVVQETFLRVYRSRANYDERWATSTWIWTIARRLGSNLARLRRPQPLRNDIHAAPPAISGTAWEIARTLLDDRAYQVLWLRYGDDLEHEEIAELTCTTPGNVRVILHRARSLLSQHLSPDGGLRNA